jgi:hypothetical protein
VGLKVAVSVVPFLATPAEDCLDITDLDLVDRLSGGRVDLTYGRYVVAACTMVEFRDRCLIARWIYSGALWSSSLIY